MKIICAERLNYFKQLFPFSCVDQIKIKKVIRFASFDVFVKKIKIVFFKSSYLNIFFLSILFFYQEMVIPKISE